MDDFTLIKFHTVDGTELTGKFFKAQGKNRPIAVMTDGLSLLQDHFLPVFAKKYQEAGISVLTYDHRGYGRSGGMPRHETNPIQQAEDYHDAVSAAMTLRDVDRKKVMIFGLGHGAAGGTVAAAQDTRVAALLIQAPFWGFRDAGFMPKGILERAWKDREAKTKMGDASPTYVQLWPNSVEEANGGGEPTWMAGPGAYGLIQAALANSQKAGVPWENKLTLQSFYYLSRLNEPDFVPHVKCPFFYVISEDDGFSGTIEEHTAVYKRNQCRTAEMRILPPNPGQTFENWLSPGADAQIDFIKRFIGL